ncbi:unnamed protein product [Ilex paraguariensis]|uniref:Protein kinase domain-containing protein n=1 Tax=Ilex paraguariensis TaxID=185542 RepID=A0ABC8RL98_9AQUA
MAAGRHDVSSKRDFRHFKKDSHKYKKGAYNDIKSSGGHDLRTTQHIESRAPELLLQTEQYSTATDMWAEVLNLNSLTRFSGLSAHQMRQFGQGSPICLKFPAATFTGSPVLTELGYDLLCKLLTYDTDKRITAEAALDHG